MPEPQSKIASAEEFVQLAAGVLVHPTLEQVDAMLVFLSSQDRDLGIAHIEDELLEIRKQLIDLQEDLANLPAA